MTRTAREICLAVLLCTLSPPLASVASAQGDASLADRVDRLEAKLTEVQTRVEQLSREKQAVQADLDRQRQEVASLRAQLAHPGVSSPNDRPKEDRSKEAALAAADNAPSDGPTTAWGTRLGYQGFPFGQEEGGFSYGFFLDHRLLHVTSDALPSSDLDVEVALGVARSGTDHIVLTSDVLGGPVPSEFRQTILTIAPSLKYYFNRWASWGIRPYLVGGPGIWADILESPPLFIGQQIPAKELHARKLPIDASADVFEGGQGGAGLELSLARTHMAIIERMNIGFDYRYTAWTAGQRYSAYAFSLSYND